MVSGSRCVSFVSHRVSRFVFRLPSPGGLCLLQLPIVFFHLSLPQLSSTCHPVVSQLSSRCGFLDVVSELPPRFLHLLSSCFPLVSRMWSPNGLLIAFHTSHLSPRIGFPIVSKCLPFVTPLFPSCLSDVDSCLSPSCLAFVLQMWSSNCLPVCSRCDLAVVFHLTPTTLSCLPDLVPQSFLNCFPVVSELPPRCGLPVVFQVYPLALNLNPPMLMDCKAGLIVSSYLDVFLYLSASPCVSHSGYRCPTLRISLVRVLVSRFPFMCSRSG